MAIVEIKQANLAFGGPPILDGAHLRIEKGERLSLLGRNAAGKSTLLRVLAGQQTLDSGEIVRSPGLRTGVLPQEVPAGLGGSVREIVAAGLPGNPATDWEEAHAVDRVLSRGRLDADADFTTLSRGNQRRVLLARALVSEPDLLLLDEPTNHLDIDAIDWLEDELRRFPGSLFFVTHDRAFLRSLAQRIIELDRGHLRDWTCDYDTFLRRREEALQVEANQRREFDRKLAEEEVWIRKGVRDRRTRNEGRVRELKEMRKERQQRRELTGEAKMRLQESVRSGRLVVRTRDLEFAYQADGPRLVDHLDTMILRGDKVGILGPNGAGKTTLLRLLLGELQATGGTIELGTNLQIAYFDQQRAGLDETASVRDNVTGGGEHVHFNGRPLHGITYLQNFLFSPDQARSPLSHLSGGERNRLLLARLFTQPANLLVLDEPTNDLDLESLELLEDLLVEFDGTILLVSHDREFLDNVTTSTLALTGEGQVVETVGGYADWARVSRKTAEVRTDRAKSGRKGKPKPPPSPGTPRKLTWKEQQELKELPLRIEAGEAEQSELHEQMADPALYQGEGARIVELKERLAELEIELEQWYARWEELEETGG